MSSRYARLLCIETNELEKIFALGGKSLPRLVKVGFYTGAIDCVRAEGVQEPQKIVAILGDLQKCLDFLTNTVKNASQLSEDTVYQIHKITLKSNRIKSSYDGENTILYLTHPGVYRKLLVTTSLTPEKIVHYTHQSKVPSEMNLFVVMMRVSGFPPFYCLLPRGENTSPFAMAAWIQAIFGRIHPFTDGNDRVSRLLASLPLIHAGYPFINVRVHKRKQVLLTVQTTPLMNVLASLMLDSINYIRSLPPTSPEDERYQISAVLGITRLSS